MGRFLSDQFVWLVVSTTGAVVGGFGCLWGAISHLIILDVCSFEIRWVS